MTPEPSPPGAARATLDPAELAPVPRTADEVRVVAISDGLWCLRLPLPFRRPRFVNCYLLADADGYLLVDCGATNAAGLPGLLRALELAGAEPAQVHTLLLTHLHADHASLAESVVGALGCRLLRGRGADTIYDSLRDPAIPLAVRRRRGLAEGIPADLLDLLVDVPLGHDGPAVRPTPDELLSPGDVIATRSGDWQVLPAPGHSPAQIVLLEPVSRTLISADVGYAEGIPYLEYGHTPDPVAEATASLRRVLALDAAVVHAGHGRPVLDPAAFFGRALENLLALPDAPLAALSTATWRTGYEVACRLAPTETNPDARGSKLSTVLCALEHLSHDERVVTRRDAAGVRWFKRTA